MNIKCIKDLILVVLYAIRLHQNRATLVTLLNFVLLSSQAMFSSSLGPSGYSTITFSLLISISIFLLSIIFLFRITISPNFTSLLQQLFSLPIGALFFQFRYSLVLQLMLLLLLLSCNWSSDHVLNCHVNAAKELKEDNDIRYYRHQKRDTMGNRTLYH
jgi:hypothetical protein